MLVPCRTSDTISGGLTNQRFMLQSARFRGVVNWTIVKDRFRVFSFWAGFGRWLRT